MTLYRDMTDQELIETALNWRVKSGQEAHKRIIYALAKRLESVDERLELVRQQRDEALRSEAPAPPPSPKPARPDSLVELHMQRRLSPDARDWLKEKRPNVWDMCKRARDPVLVAAWKQEQDAAAERMALLQNQGMGAAAFGAFAGTGASQVLASRLGGGPMLTNES